MSLFLHYSLTKVISGVNRFLEIFECKPTAGVHKASPLCSAIYTFFTSNLSNLSLMKEKSKILAI